MAHLAIVLHILVAVAILAMMGRHVGERAQAVSNLRAIAEGEQAHTGHLRQELQQTRQILEAKRQGNPYVVELLTRSRLGWTRPGELVVPADR